jgi:hypothetical protein
MGEANNKYIFHINIVFEYLTNDKQLKVIVV